MHRVIYDELCQGNVLAESRQQYRDVIRSLVEAGAEAVILGYTEIGLLIQPVDRPVPIFDTTAHAQAAVQFCCNSSAAI